MAEPRALQPADQAPDYSGRDTSTAADRRPEVETPVTSEAGTHAAPAQPGPIDLIWRAGQPAPSVSLRPEIVRCGPEEGRDGEDRIVEIETTSAYGDAYDPEAPMRVMVDRRWNFDPDNDGKV